MQKRFLSFPLFYYSSLFLLSALLHGFSCCLLVYPLKHVLLHFPRKIIPQKVNKKQSPIIFSLRGLHKKLINIIVQFSFVTCVFWKEECRSSNKDKRKKKKIQKFCFFSQHCSHFHYRTDSHSYKKVWCKRAETNFNPTRKLLFSKTTKTIVIYLKVKKSRHICRNM